MIGADSALLSLDLGSADAQARHLFAVSASRSKEGATASWKKGKSASRQNFNLHS